MIAALIRRFGGFDEETEARLHALRLAAALELERRRSRAFASRGSAGVKPAPVAEGRMREASTTRRLPAGAAALLRLAALASLAFVSAAGLSRAKDRCADTAQAVQALHEDDHYQATTLIVRGRAARLRGASARAPRSRRGDRREGSRGQDRARQSGRGGQAAADQAASRARRQCQRARCRRLDAALLRRRAGSRRGGRVAARARRRSQPSRPEGRAPACRRGLQRFDGKRRCSS